MNNTQENIISIILTAESHQVARKFAVQQDNSKKAKQVYLNTLAIFAVKDFLEQCPFETELTQGDSWEPIIRCVHNVADIVLPNIGKLECKIKLLFIW